MTSKKRTVLNKKISKPQMHVIFNFCLYKLKIIKKSLHLWNKCRISKKKSNNIILNKQNLIQRDSDSESELIELILQYCIIKSKIIYNWNFLKMFINELSKYLFLKYLIYFYFILVIRKISHFLFFLLFLFVKYLISYSYTLFLTRNSISTPFILLWSFLNHSNSTHKCRRPFIWLL